MPKLGQKGIAQIFVVLILLLGIIGGVYLVKHPTIFRPKAAAPEAGPEYVQWLTQMHELGIYPAQENGEIVLYNKEQFLDKYCKDTPCYLEDQSYDEIISRAESNGKDFTGLLAETLYKDGYSPFETLQVYFPDLNPKQLGGIYPTQSQQSNLKTEIDEVTLSRYIRAMETELNPSYRSTFDILIDSADPIFGTRAMINWLTLPPNKLSYEEKTNALIGFSIVYGLTEKVTVKGIQLTSGTVINLSRMLEDVTLLRRAIKGGETVKLDSMTMKVKGKWLTFEEKIPDVQMLPKVPAGWELYFKDIQTLLDNHQAYALSSQITRPVFETYLSKLLTYDAGELGRRIPYLKSDIGIQHLLETADNNLVIVTNPEAHHRLFGGRKWAFAQGPFIVVAGNWYKTPGLLEHEFTHVISYLLPGSKSARHFIYNKEQANTYGAIMSQIYELSTDIVLEELYGLEGGYKYAYPELSKTMDRLIEALAERGVRISRTDYMEFALTGNDQILRNRIFENLSPEAFLRLVNRTMNTVKFEEMVEAARQKTRKRIFQFTTGGGALTTGGVFFYSNVWANNVSGENNIPEDAVIIPDELNFDEDIDLTYPDSP